MSRDWIARPKSLAVFRRAAESAAAADLSAWNASARGASRCSRSCFVPLDRRELGLGLDSPCGQLVGRAMEPRRQPPVECQPSLDLLEPGRVVVPALTQVAQAVGHLAGLVGQPLEGRDGLGQLGHRIRQGLEAARDPLEDLLGGMIGLVEQVVALGRGRAEGLGVGQQVRLAHQLVVLAQPGIGRGQLVTLELEQGPLALPGLGCVDQGLPPPPQAVVGGPGPAIRLERLVQAAEGVEQAALAVGIEQGPSLVLAVDVDQLLAQPLKGRDRHGHPVDLGRAAALSGDSSRDDQLVLVDSAAQDVFELAPQRLVLDQEDRGGPGLLPCPPGPGRPRPSLRAPARAP